MITDHGTSTTAVSREQFIGSTYQYMIVDATRRHFVMIEQLHSLAKRVLLVVVTVEMEQR